MPRKPHKRKVKPALRIQYAALPYRFTPAAALEILLVTTRTSKRWIIPKGWPIKGLKPAKSAAREAFEEAGVRGRVAMKSIGLFNYDKLLAENGIPVNCEVRVFPLLVKRQSEAWPEFEQRRIQWVEPARAVALIKEPGLKKLVAAFAKKIAVAASKTVP
ncbi:MAG: NUDIX hydrolase [Roseiarcus sp.]|uniref:NUDIX hydrolase n=1 Tax=Roseiarcus sp. TaxID=1969460 RepID=UPI003BAEB9BE